MESNYNNRDFEQFVKQNADQYRMFPSEKVWQGIDNALHTRRKWYGLGLALLLFITGAGVTWVMITTPGNKDLNTTAQVLPSEKKNIPAKVIPVQQSRAAEKNTNAPLVVSTDAVQKPGSSASIDDILINIEPQPEHISKDVAGAPLSSEPAGVAIEETANIVVSVAAQKASKTTGSPVFTTVTPDPNLLAANTIPATDMISIPDTEKKPVETISETKQVTADYLPLTIESVVNSYKRPAAKKKVQLQFYFTPTVSYRMLSENKEFLRYAASQGVVPTYAAYNDVKNYVTHKPDIGLELGLSARYALSKRLVVKAGVQFNVSRYDIRAFDSPSDSATVRLNATGRDTAFVRETTYQTRSNGNRADWLQNLYYSISVPIGIEFRIAEKKKNYFGVGATIQPTYMISDRAYLISTNYKNYLEVPGSILRRLNLNSGLEFFVGYSTDKYRWQIGPQVRYQIRSTFKDKYPVKENLFDFGIKVGVMLNKKSF